MADGMVAGERLEKKVMERTLGCRGQQGTLTFVCSLASCFSSRLVCL